MQTGIKEWKLKKKSRQNDKKKETQRSRKKEQTGLKKYPKKQRDTET